MRSSGLAALSLGLRQRIYDPPSSGKEQDHDDGGEKVGAISVARLIDPELSGPMPDGSSSSWRSAAFNADASRSRAAPR